MHAARSAVWTRRPLRPNTALPQVRGDVAALTQRDDRVPARHPYGTLTAPRSYDAIRGVAPGLRVGR